MRVLVCGGRDFKNWKLAAEVLDFWHARLSFTLLIQGGQVSVNPNDHQLPWEERQKWGADYIAKRWALLRGVPQVEEAVSKEEWKKFGLGAGPMRNSKMLARHKPERVIAFPGGAGTSNMLQQARLAGVKCIEVASTSRDLTGPSARSPSLP